MTTAVRDWRSAQQKAGKRLKALLIERDMSQTDVAEAMGLTRSSMSDYLNARRRWPADFEARFREVVNGKADAA